MAKTSLHVKRANNHNFYSSFFPPVIHPLCPTFSNGRVTVATKQERELAEKSMSPLLWCFWLWIWIWVFQTSLHVWGFHKLNDIHQRPVHTIWQRNLWNIKCRLSWRTESHPIITGLLDYGSQDKTSTVLSQPSQIDAIQMHCTT